jgi:hypothetical protein
MKITSNDLKKYGDEILSEKEVSNGDFVNKLKEINRKRLYEIS